MHLLRRPPIAGMSLRYHSECVSKIDQRRSQRELTVGMQDNYVPTWFRHQQEREASWRSKDGWLTLRQGIYLVHSELNGYPVARHISQDNILRICNHNQTRLAVSRVVELAKGLTGCGRVICPQSTSGCKSVGAADV